ncbi:hypothetical protein [Vibrio vulnificus YJ016]|uniref:Uncharacterized protein n=1 Tax=Vibrio vulnificus (strain YJ016) TaxID=196600 RepID=Q7MJR2_VIBVY|nr:hypothetical protein [Vibrio vulnificus YJ016]
MYVACVEAGTLASSATLPIEHNMGMTNQPRFIIFNLFPWRLPKLRVDDIDNEIREVAHFPRNLAYCI